MGYAGEFFEAGLWRVAPRALDVAQVDGPDPIQALQKVVAADLRGMSHGEARGCLLLHPKGQFRALFAVGLWHGDTWLLAPPGWGLAAWEQLQRYLRFSRCQVKPWGGPRTLLLGAGWHRALEALKCSGDNGGQLPCFAETLVGLPGGVVLSPIPTHSPPVDQEMLELARIQVGFPAWGKELTEDVLPQEVGLGEPWVSLTKGCYVGQETMARLATYGHVQRLLVRLEGRPTPGKLDEVGPFPWTLTLPEGGKSVGRITSGVMSKTGELRALGLVQRAFAVDGQTLSACGVSFKVATVFRANPRSTRARLGRIR